MAAPEKTCLPSKQLLYCEKYEDKDEKLRIIEKTKMKRSPGPKKTFRPPPSSVLSRVRDFIPAMISANERLSTLPASEVNIEHIDPELHKGPLIQMNLALAPCVSSSSEDESEDCSDDSDDDKEEPHPGIVEMDLPEQTEDALKPPILNAGDGGTQN